MQRIHELVINPSLFQSKEQNLDQVWLSLCENDFLIQYVIFVFLFSVNNCSLLLISQPMLVATKVGSKGDGTTAASKVKSYPLFISLPITTYFRFLMVIG
jgi:uncharacterized membrane protein